MALYELIISLAATLLGAGFLFYGIRKGSESSIVSSYVPVDSIKAIPSEIPVVVSGTIGSENAILSPITKKQCVYYKVILEKQVEDKDVNGNTTVHWTTVGDPQDTLVQFYLEDSSGKILVKPDRAEISGENKYESYLTPGSVSETGGNGLEKIVGSLMQTVSSVSKLQERVTEYSLTVGSNINVFGILSMEGDQQFFEKTKQYPLLLTTKSKDQLVTSEKTTSRIFSFFGIFVLAAGIFFLLKSMHVL